MILELFPESIALCDLCPLCLCEKRATTARLHNSWHFGVVWDSDKARRCLRDLGGVYGGLGVADALDVTGVATVELEVGTLGFEDERGSKNFLKSSSVNGVDMRLT